MVSVPDLDDDIQPGGCPECDGELVWFELEPPDPHSRGWRCLTCRIEWAPDGENGVRALT